MWHSDIDVLLQLKSQSRILNIELWLLALGYQSPHHIHCKLYRNIILIILTQLTGILGTFWALKCLLYLATRLISWPEPAAGMTVGPPSSRPWPGWDKSGQEKCSPPSDVQTQTCLPTCCQCAYTKIGSYSFIKFSFNFSPHPMYFGGMVLLKCLCLWIVWARGCEGGGWLLTTNVDCLELVLPVGARTVRGIGSPSSPSALRLKTSPNSWVLRKLISHLPHVVIRRPTDSWFYW